jgi:RHS repeat-associated protein
LSADEVAANGTLVHTPPQRDADVDLTHAYDAGDQRVLKTATVGTEQVHTVYVFGSLELRRARYGLDGELDYEQTSLTEVPYLMSNGVRLARVVFEEPLFALPRVGSGKRHVVLELGDHLGSTSLAIDQKTSELVEASTYQPYGAAESDYRPARWDAFREDYRFTGKEEDVEVGLQYFGKRYLSPQLGRWASADPLAVHMPGRADPNLYAYVHGRLYQATDPVGFDDVLPKWEDIKTDVRQMRKNDPNVAWRQGTGPAFGERAIWRAVVGQNLVAKKLMDAYISNRDPNTVVHLSKFDVVAMHAQVDFLMTDAVNQKVIEMRKELAQSGADHITRTGVEATAAAWAEGTLAGCTGRFKGSIDMNKDGTFVLKGVVRFEDRYDFDIHDPAKESKRSTWAKIEVWLAHKTAPGTPFKVETDWVTYEQAGGMVGHGGTVAGPETADVQQAVEKTPAPSTGASPPAGPPPPVPKSDETQAP